jgi:hypothetical protein
MPVTDVEHDVFTRPPADAQLWRYVDLAKYLSLLSTQALWFSRADLLGDRFEGSISKATMEQREKAYSEFPGLLRSMDQLAESRRKALRFHFISCWHCSERESAAMWRLYMKDHGIAIVTTYDRMRSALGGEDEIYVGFVRYIDYDSQVIPEGNWLWPYMHKRRSFEHEHEVRAILTRWPLNLDPPPKEGEGERSVIDWDRPTLPGVAVPVDIPALIQEVRIIPDAPSWFADVVQDVTRRYDFNFPVTPSELGGDPLY